MFHSNTALYKACIYNLPISLNSPRWAVKLRRDNALHLLLSFFYYLFSREHIKSKGIRVKKKTKQKKRKIQQPFLHKLLCLRRPLKMK